MTDQALDILKLVLLALLYLFFARVLWAVWSEVRSPVNARFDSSPQPQPGPVPPVVPGTDTLPAPRPARARRGVPGKLVILEPKERRGTTFNLGAAVTIGRDPDNTVVIVGDAYVSGHHARVASVGDGVAVDDLGSRNGTYLNGTLISNQRSVHPGDRIQIGYTVLEAK